MMSSTLITAIIPPIRFIMTSVTVSQDEPHFHIRSPDSGNQILDEQIYEPTVAVQSSNAVG